MIDLIDKILLRLSVKELIREKYSPTQPRAPKGDPQGGQWVSKIESGIDGNAGNYARRSEYERKIIDKIIYGASPDGELVSGDRLSDYGISGTITVYRGVPVYAEDHLRGGDFVLLDAEMARAYSPKGKIITERVPTKDLIFYQKNGYQIEMRYEPSI